MNGIMIGLLISISLVVAAPPPAVGAAPDIRKGFVQMAKPGEKIAFDAGHYFTYVFERPPKIGMSIMRVEIFSRDGKRDSSYVVKGDADMPSMRGAHASGDKEFVLSAKGVYLLPLRFVMPGDWEVAVTFLKKGMVVYRGVYLFDI